MPKRQLTKMKSPDHLPPRWRKKYKGKIYYFRGDYKNALAEWKAKKATIDIPTKIRKQYQTALENWSKLARVQIQLGEDPTEALQVVATLNRAIEEGKAVSLPDFFLCPEEIAEEEEFLEYADHAKLRALMDQIAPPDTLSVQKAIEKFLDLKKTQVNLGQLTLHRWKSLRIYLNHFAKFIGPQKSITGINEETLRAYYDYIAGRIEEKTLKSSTGRSWFNAAKQFIKYLAEHHDTTPPKNLGSRELAISDPPVQIEVFSDQELKDLFSSEKVKPRHRLYFLLMLNCGYGQTDIANLRQDQVDWENGRIIRKRSKTHNHESTPTVNYFLWRETFQLLKKYRSGHPERVLINSSSKPLQPDVVGRSLRNLSSKSPKFLRKTGASKIAEHPVYGRFYTLYLGHSPKSIADKHYVTPPQDLFDEAISWLRDQMPIG